MHPFWIHLYLLPKEGHIPTTEWLHWEIVSISSGEQGMAEPLLPENKPNTVSKRDWEEITLNLSAFCDAHERTKQLVWL